ncbi:hypothetical protein QC763_108770 [Podospora pseudopauciseta]|uniref:RING-type domain-containing protein n=1 Tax=Podospora pseudopauciseta TaxID=2093780 RepID=A0ABR0HYV5_9PEZI|nr:hypothetical protein QC763_108770 [Podospora pseudopauciseta]
MPELLQAGVFDKDTLPLLKVILWAALQAMALAAVGNMTSGPNRPIYVETTPVDDDPLRIDPPDETPNAQGKDKGKQANLAVSLPQNSPTTWLPPPQLENEELNDGEHFLVDYPLPETLSSYPPALKDIPDTIRTVVRLSIDAVFERARSEKEAAVALAQRVAQDTARQEEEEQATENQQMTEENELPAESLTTAVVVSLASRVEDQSLPSEAQTEPERPTLKPSRSWRRRVFFHRHLERYISQTGEKNKNQETPGSPSAFTRLTFKTLNRPSDGTKESREEIECTACLEPTERADSVKAAICNHTYCKPCFEQLVLTGLQTEAQFPPKCCLNPIPCRTITKYTSRSTRKLYNEKSTEYATTDRIYCPIPDCGRWHDKTTIITPQTGTITTPYLKCTKGHKMCPICHQKAHKKTEYCPQDPDYLRTKAFIQESGWQKCHRCKRVVEHVSGCRHMTCPCGGQFCYVCGARWKTCFCTDRQVDVMKSKAAARRHEKQQQQQSEPASSSQASQPTTTPADESTLARLTQISEHSSLLTFIMTSITDHQSDILITSHSRETSQLVKSHALRRRSLNLNQSTALARMQNSHIAGVASLQKQHEAVEREFSLKVGEFPSDSIPDAGKSPEERKLQTGYVALNQKMRSTQNREMGMLKLEQIVEKGGKDRELMREREKLEQELGQEARELRRRQVMEAEWGRLVWEERGRMLREMEEREREVVILEGGGE